MSDAGHEPGSGLPINWGPASSDEYEPQPHDAFVSEVVRRTHDACDSNARHTGVSRRQFVRTTCGAATALLVLDACSKEATRRLGGEPGGTYSLSPETATEPAAAETSLAGQEFIFDVQSHLLDDVLDPEAAAEIELLTGNLPQRNCGEHDPNDCFSIEHFLRNMFLRSDTDLVVLSAVPLPNEHDPLSPEVMALTRRVAGVLCHDDRVLLHGKVTPTTQPLNAALAGMEQLVATQPIVGWKTYTHLLGPGWWLDDHDPSAPAVGDAMIRNAVELDVPRIAVHRGIRTAPYNTPEDIGPAARRHPDVSFLVYHSGYEIGVPEGPFTGRTANRGTNRLIASMRKAGVGPNENVYAELGTTWWQVMRYPTQAAHLLGKLLRYVGENNVVWGTDSIWYGPPQDQIRAFRAFEISPALQERYGYPALTKAVKAKILGLNGARVYGVEPTPPPCHFTRRELAQLRQRAAADSGR